MVVVVVVVIDIERGQDASVVEKFDATSSRVGTRAGFEINDISEVKGERGTREFGAGSDMTEPSSIPEIPRADMTAPLRHYGGSRALYLYMANDACFHVLPEGLFSNRGVSASGGWTMW